jgi:ABC-type Na+ efflux pump permease subunit
MAIGTLAKKELRLLLRDRLAVVILLLMPFVFIFVLGLLLGEGFGQKPDDRLRVSLVDEDWGTSVREGMAWFMVTPSMGGFPGGVHPPELAALATASAGRYGAFPYEPWSKVVQRDLAETAGIRVEIIGSRQEAERLCNEGKRSAVLVFGPTFTEQIARCSFLADGINPFYREGVKLSRRNAGQPRPEQAMELDVLDVELIRDPTQLTAASIIEQVAQVSLLRVVLPWMIGKAFERISETAFIDRLALEVRLPIPSLARAFFKVDKDGKTPLRSFLLNEEYKQAVGTGVQNALRSQFPKYELTGKTWAALTRSEPGTGEAAGVTHYTEEGSGFLRRGAARYQILVPSSVVMFAFFLVLTVGWLFVSERRQGTLQRLRAAPITRLEILTGKLLPCYLVSLGQAAFLLLAGKLLFGMRWGPDHWPTAVQVLGLLPVVLTTSLAAMGLALLVAALARTEIQVAIFGTLLVIALAFISGCLIPRELMPEEVRHFTLITPHAWALDAYRQLMLNPQPNLTLVAWACAALTGFGATFLALAWWFLWVE